LELGNSHHILSPAGLDFSAPDLAIAPRASTARKANAAGMKKISGRPTVATPRAPVRPPRALLTAVELMKIKGRLTYDFDIIPQQRCYA
jgi:hypothetical protein